MAIDFPLILDAFDYWSTNIPSAGLFHARSSQTIINFWNPLYVYLQFKSCQTNPPPFSSPQSAEANPISGVRNVYNRAQIKCIPFKCCGLFHKLNRKMTTKPSTGPTSLHSVFIHAGMMRGKKLQNEINSNLHFKIPDGLQKHPPKWQYCFSRLFVMFVIVALINNRILFVYTQLRSPHACTNRWTRTGTCWWDMLQFDMFSKLYALMAWLGLGYEIRIL